MTEHSESTRQSDQQQQARPDAPAAGDAVDAPAPAAPQEKPTVYRGGAALVGGLIVAVLCVLGIIDLLVEGGTQDLVGVGVLALVTSLAFAYGIYPAAYATSDRLRIRNPFRTIEVPWSAVTDLTAKLSFVVHTEPARYTVWAIPVSLHERRKADRVRLKEVTRADRDARRSARGGTRLSDIQIPTSRRADPIERLSYADQALQEMGERRESYAQKNKNAPASAPKMTWAWPMPAAILASVLLIVLAAVL